MPNIALNLQLPLTPSCVCLARCLEAPLGPSLGATQLCSLATSQKVVRITLMNWTAQILVILCDSYLHGFKLASTLKNILRQLLELYLCLYYGSLNWPITLLHTRSYTPHRRCIFFPWGCLFGYFLLILARWTVVNGQRWEELAKIIGCGPSAPSEQLLLFKFGGKTVSVTFSEWKVSCSRDLETF